MCNHPLSGVCPHADKKCVFLCPNGTTARLKSGNNCPAQMGHTGPPGTQPGLFFLFFLACLGSLGGGNDLIGLQLRNEIVVVELHGE